MSVIHIDYIFLTIKSKNLRAVVGNKKGYASIVYTCPLENTEDEDIIYFYRGYVDGLTEQEGKELQRLIEEKQTRKANNFLLKNLKTEKCLGPCGEDRLSNLVPDDWFDGCKWAIDKLYYHQFKGVYSMDFEVEDFW